LQDLRALVAELDEQFPSARTASPFRTPDATTDQAFCDLWGDGVTHGAQDGDRAHSICGTAEYMSPEMVEHLGYGFMSEVWSYGVFIYEMLTGATPFECDSPQYDSQSVLKKIREFTVLEFPTDVHIDRDAKLLISSLLRRKETDRLGSKDPVGDYKSIKEHSWFSEIDWGKVSTGEQNGHITVPFKMPKEALPASTSQQWSATPVAKGANVASFDNF
jgi:serine/threonine protein kinase